MQKNNIIAKILPQEMQQYMNVLEQMHVTGIANDVSMTEMADMRCMRDRYAAKFHYYLQEHTRIVEGREAVCATILDHKQKQQLQKLLYMTSGKYQAMLKICQIYQEKHDAMIVADFELLV